MTKTTDITPKWRTIPFKESVVLYNEGFGQRIGGIAGFGGTPATAVNNAVKTVKDSFDSNHNFIREIINDKLNTSTKTILSDFTFGESGAIQIGTYEAGFSGDIRISPNGIVGRNKTGATTFTIDGTTGDPTFAGTLVAAAGTLGALEVASNGFIRGGQTAYNTGVGFWMGYYSGAYKFSLGNPDGDYIYWDGNGLYMKGELTLEPGTKIPWSDITDDGHRPADDATVGATWGTNLSNIPATLGTPSGTGLFLSGTYLGYYDSPNWKTYMDSSGNFYLGGTSGKLQWVAATNTLTISGSITITGGSGIANLSDAGDLAVLDSIGATNCNTTIISGGKIITGLLTASNIQTGTLNASLVTVTNLNATNITTGTLTGLTVQTANSGARVVMGGGTEWIKFYDATLLCGTLYGSGGSLLIVAGQTDKNVTIAGGSTSGNAALAGCGAVKLITTSTGVSVSGNIAVTGTVDGIDISTHAATASAHHSSTSDNLTITPANVDIKADGYIKRAGTNYARLTSLGFDMYQPLGLKWLSSVPGSASTYKGFMYYDTTQTTIVFSNGTNWYKVTAEKI